MRRYTIRSQVDLVDSEQVNVLFGDPRARRYPEVKDECQCRVCKVRRRRAEEWSQR